jgi:hypothetical protein
MRIWNQLALLLPWRNSNAQKTAVSSRRYQHVRLAAASSGMDASGNQHHHEAQQQLHCWPEIANHMTGWHAEPAAYLKHNYLRTITWLLRRAAAAVVGHCAWDPWSHQQTAAAAAASAAVDVAGLVERAQLRV